MIRPRGRGPREQPADPCLRPLWSTHPRSTSPRPAQTVASLSFGATSWVPAASVASVQPRSHYLLRGNYTYAALRRGVLLITAATGERESP
ncbi:Uncharacterised protein [Amycolatopsis camponoti]|uniref:Uncharacterized protein n=1 Tax=Amycolatopsis camponoti TaxID=2606593 RepID=A0A6I8M599_9PSEU|nr:Uncharacterised protein [Amycolatopsis camponoti]